MKKMKTKKIIWFLIVSIIFVILASIIWWEISHSVFGLKITFLTVVLIRIGDLVVMVILDHALRKRYYKVFLSLLKTELENGERREEAIRSAKGKTDVKIAYYLALLIALNMQREIRSRRHNSTAWWRKVISYITFGYY